MKSLLISAKLDGRPDGSTANTGRRVAKRVAARTVMAEIEAQRARRTLLLEASLSKHHPGPTRRPESYARRAATGVQSKESGEGNTSGILELWLLVRRGRHIDRTPAFRRSHSPAGNEGGVDDGRESAHGAAAPNCSRAAPLTASTGGLRGGQGEHARLDDAVSKRFFHGRAHGRRARPQAADGALSLARPQFI